MAPHYQYGTGTCLSLPILPEPIMKKIFTATLLTTLCVTTPLVLAQDAHSAHHETASASTEVGLAQGTVKKIDRSAGKLTIAHGPLESLGMPAMTMAFRAAEAGMLDQVAAGDRIRFAVERIGGVLTITTIEPAQ